jgi:succinate-semialdehyde dehydrogenase/glutarate-semialdehyde dehydrogenase
MTQVIPALAAGNAIVLKPSEFTPWSGKLVADVFEEAGLSPGLLEIVLGDGTIGGALIESGPDKIVFTGSVRTGRQVLEAASKRMIPCVLELGGKDAMIVLADADLEIASSAAVWGAFTNCGQVCLSVERVYVEKPVASRMIELCVGKAKRLRLGNGLDPETEIGPMIRPKQIEVVEEHLRDAVNRGARILCGGKRRPDLGGYFFEPTVVVDVDHGMRLMQEETFGPVLAIQVVEDVEEAIERANDSSFGLGASVWTRDSRRGEQIARKLVAGAVMVNDVISYYAICEAPHGGRRSSGIGHTHSRLGLLEMVQVKYIDVERLSGLHKTWWYGYSRALLDAADSFLQLVFARRWGLRLRGLPGSWRALFRGDRI